MPKRKQISYAQAQLPFRGAATRLVQDPLKREWQALTSAGVLAVLLMAVYGYCVVNSIAQVSLRETAFKESRTLAAERATLEGRLLDTERGITVAYARTLGFQEGHEKVFVTRQTALSYGE